MGLHLFLLRYLGIRGLIANIPKQLLPISRQTRKVSKEYCSLSALYSNTCNLIMLQEVHYQTNMA